MLDINAAVERLVTDTVTVEHSGDVAVAEDNRFQKLIMIGLNTTMEDVAEEDTVQRMALVLEEEHIDFYIVLHRPYVGYLNNNHGTTLQEVYLHIPMG